MAESRRVRFPNGCPRCGRGRICVGFMTLNDACEHCGLKFMRESGQHLGAAAVAYGMSAAVALPLFFVLLVNRATPAQAVGIPTLVLAVLSPLNVRLSRQLWAHALFLIGR